MHQGSRGRECCIPVLRDVGVAGAGTEPRVYPTLAGFQRAIRGVQKEERSKGVRGCQQDTQGRFRTCESGGGGPWVAEPLSEAHPKERSSTSCTHYVERSDWRMGSNIAPSFLRWLSNTG